MDYPAWYVPFITAPMLIPLVAIPHVIVAQFAVGGGFVLADLVRRAYRDRSQGLLDYLKGLARIFTLVTIVFGAVTGVGIWWTIGLASPETTSALIHIFVFGWAAEWAVFVLEIASAFAFYYLWDRLSAREHIAVGWTYAISAWVSLVLITGITAFMLTSGSWSPARGFFVAFFNPSFLPQVLLRTGGSLALAALGIGLHASFQHAGLLAKDRLIRWISQWALAGMALIIAGGLWYLAVMPEHAKLNMVRAPILVTMLALNFAVTLVVVAALALGHVVGSRWITPPSAILLLLAGALAVATGEFVREGTRKPYHIEGYIFAPGVRVKDVDSFHREGLIAHARWLRFYLSAHLTKGARSNLNVLPIDAKAKVGEGIFRYHCASCHAVSGYNGMRPLIQPWTAQLIRDALRNLHRTNPAMPPWLGNEAERQALAAYLVRLSREGK
ncbi:MAG: cytochrome ubiquinol oxidase subunit I [Deltaproteobacteria bacterium]|nr:cytochrome ubiquinol oxidase subunit I [Deltaproteobacteria bacterium]